MDTNHDILYGISEESREKIAQEERNRLHDERKFLWRIQACIDPNEYSRTQSLKI